MRKRTSPTPVCHDCGVALVRDTRPLSLAYRGETTVVDQPGWYCPRCGEGVVEGADLLATRADRTALKARVEGVLTPGDVRRTRSRLKLSQRAAGQLLGGGPRAFQKYESGEVTVSQPMSNLLRLLDKDPRRLSELTRGAAA